MESWSYGSEVKSFKFSGELGLNTERNRQVLKDWDLKNLKSSSADLGNPLPVLGFLDRQVLVGKPLPGDRIPEIPGNKAGNARSSSFLVGPGVFSEEYGSGGGVLNSVADSNSRESLVDLKLGRLSDCKDGKSGTHLNEKSGLSSVVINTPPLLSKRTRSVNCSNLIPLCQVHGCNTDLSSSKDYHKRHKVCELHSKAAKVVVNSLEQRFCQQCSRFHLLAEFDEVKRSCRKRLAGHNERRRKHHLETHSEKFRRLLTTRHDNKFPVTPLLPKTSFICPEIFSSGGLREVKYGNSAGCSAVKVEEERIYNGELHIPTTNGFLFSKSSLPPHSIEKPFPSLQEIDSMGRSFYCESSSNQYARTFTTHNPPFFDASSAIEGLSRVPDSGCALSLLSCQSQGLSTQSSGLPMLQPLMGQCDPTHYNVGQFSDKLLELAASSQASTSVGSARFSSSGMNSVGDDHLGPVLVSDASDAIDFEVQTDGLFQNSFANAKDEISQEGIHTVDLLQLSSQFHSAENQRHSRQEKLGNGIFYWNHIA